MGREGKINADAGIIAYWPFDEGSGDVATDVVGGADAQLTDIDWVPGQLGGSAAESSRGGDQILVDPGPTPTTQDLSIAWWMVDTYDSWHTMMNKCETDSTAGYSILLRPTSEDSPLRFRIGGFQAYGGWGFECRVPAGAYNDGDWTHVVCTYDFASDTASIYINCRRNTMCKNPNSLMSSVLASVICLACITVAQAQLPEPVSMWRFEEGSGGTTVDGGTGGHHGILVGNVAFADDPDRGSVLEFGASESYVETNAWITELGDADFSVAAWIQTREEGVAIISKSNGDRNWSFHEKQFYLSAGSEQGQPVAGGVHFYGNQAGEIWGATAVNKGRWHHVCATWDNDTDEQHIYVDGVLVRENQPQSRYPANDSLDLDFGTTYYWRIDEVNGAPDYTIHKGETWQFTTEPITYPIASDRITVTASGQAANQGPENTINGSGMDNGSHSDDITAMWLTAPGDPAPYWIQYDFDKAYKLAEMWVWNQNGRLEPAIGFGFKDVTVEYSTNGADFATLGTTHEFARAPGVSGYTHNSNVDFGGAAIKSVRLTANTNWGGILQQYGLSEVAFMITPVSAREPYPDFGAAEVDVDAILSWRAGREVAAHDVYLSGDEQAVIDGTASVGTVAETSFIPLSLDVDTTYYWRIDEVNDAQTPTTWSSDIWSFTTVDSIVVDNFELYNDVNPDQPGSNRIFDKWIDGYGTATNGALVGNDDPPHAE